MEPVLDALLFWSPFVLFYMWAFHTLLKEAKTEADAIWSFPSTRFVLLRRMIEAWKGLRLISPFQFFWWFNPI